MAIGTASAILGAAVIGTAGGAIASSKAAKTAANASRQAADQNAQVQREIYNQTRSDLAPYNQAGQGALGKLMVRLGITPMSGAAGSPTRPTTYAPANGPTSKANSQPYGGLGGGQPLGNAPGGLRPQAPDPGPGPAPAGKEWVHGPEGYILRDVRQPTSFGNVMGGLGVGGKANNTVAPSGLRAAAQPGSPYAGTPGGWNQPGTTMDWGLGPGGEASDALIGGSGSDTLAPPAAPQGGPDYAAYRSANPDVAQWAQQAVAQGAFASEDEAAASHYREHGQNEGRNLPTAGAAPADPNAPPPEYYQETYAERPADMEVPTYQRAPDIQAPTYGAGPQFSWDPSQIANDKGFQFETAETAKGVNSNFAARGRLRSGGAAKALQDRLFGVAHTYGNDYFNRALQGYNANRNAFESDRGFTEDRYRYGQDRGDRNFLDDRSYGTNLWNTRQNRADSIFSEDRGFTANRNDVATGNLFNLVGVGQGAAAGTAAAGQNYANGVTNSNNQAAAARANAAIANGQNVSNLFGSAAGAIGTYYGLRGGGAGGSFPRTYNI